jgi:hypothetical protein
MAAPCNQYANQTQQESSVRWRSRVTLRVEDDAECVATCFRMADPWSCNLQE